MSTQPQLSPLEQLAQNPQNAPSNSDGLSPLERLAQGSQDHGQQTPPTDRWNNFDPDQPLTSHMAATRAAVGGLASDTLSAVKGAVSFLNPKPQSESEGHAFAVGGIGGVYVHRMLESMSPVARAAMHPSEIADAIHTINNSPDPKAAFLKIAQRTASQGAAQALVAAGTAGAAKTAPFLGSLGDVAGDVTKGVERAQVPAKAALTEGGETAASNVSKSVPKSNPDLQAFRARSVGDEGIPADSHAQASMSKAEVQQRVVPGREAMTGKPQEVVSTDLSHSSGFSVKPGPNGANWVKFHEEVPEANVVKEGAAQPTGPTTVRSVLDHPIETLSKAEKTTYNTINRASGTDLKSLYDSANEIQDALDDPTNIGQRSALQKELKTTQDQIAQGEAAAKENGVDPSLLQKAVQMTKQRYALEEVAKRVFGNESVVKGNATHGAPESINIDAAIRNVENLDKPSRYAPRGTPTRLVQAFGEEGAAKLKKALYDAQAKGELAETRQQFAVKLAKLAGAGGAVLLGGELAKGALGHGK